MLLPESMTKILIVGSKEQLERTIELLYDMESVHLVDFSSEEEGMSLGAPLKQASSASQKLLKLRAVEKDLEIEEGAVEEKVTAERIRKEFDEALAALQIETAGVADSKNKIQQRLGELDSKKKELELFRGLPLDLGLYKGYESITVFVGPVRADPEGVLRESLENFELFKSAGAKHVALFVDNKEATEAQRLLVQNGYSEVAIPEGEGNPEDIINTIEKEEAQLSEKLEEVSGVLEKLRDKHISFVLAADEELSIEVEKAETPLRFGATDHAFVIDAWVPTKKIKFIEKSLNDGVGGDIHLEILKEQDRKGEEEAEHKGEEDPDNVPVDFDNGKTVSRFQFLIELVSMPKYNEADPTWLVSIFFPLFFGFMVGDVAYGLSFLMLGWLGLRKCTTPEWRTISTMLFYGGIWATIIGLFFFGEALGMHFAPTGHEGDITWTALFHQMGIEFEFPHQIDLGFTAIPLGIYSKLHDVKILLYISLWIGVAHLFVGFVMGAANVAMRHGAKEALFEKVSWMLILIGGVMFGLEMINILILGQDFVLGPIFIGGIALIIVGTILAVKAEGGAAILELPELMSNIFSYTRLTAIGMSKAGMALAFNTIAIVLIAPGGGIMIVFALLIFIIGHLMIFILAILSAGLHGIRLQYVEFFTKFFEGGGSKFNPLKIVRKYTTEV
jgi:V/A-type H+-transporting ATPase subunit I